MFYICGKSISLFPVTYNNNLKVTPIVLQHEVSFNESSFESDGFPFTLLYWVILHWYYLTLKALTLIHSQLLQNVFFFTSKIVSFTSSRMKKIIVFPVRFGFPVKLVCFIVFRSAPSDCCLLKSVAINLQFSLKFV